MESIFLRHTFTRRVFQGNEFIWVPAFYALLKLQTDKQILGRSQVVRHRSLEPAFVGSNPPAPAKFELSISNCRLPILLALRHFTIGNWQSAIGNDL